MALLGNGYLALSPLPMNYVGGAVGVAYPGNNRAMFARGNRMNQFSAFGQLASLPDGVSPHYSWVPRNKAGRMSARSHTFTIRPTAVGGLGMPGSGSATITISTNEPDGELIVSGSGSTTFTISTNNPLLTASVNGTGSASFTIETNVPILGAEANIIGTGSISITTNAPMMYPLDDESPLRTATATIIFDGSITRYAVGHMVGTTEVTDVVTNESVAAAVWNAMLLQFQDAGSAGEALAAAGAGGVNYTALASAVWEHATRSMTTAERDDAAAAILAAAQVTPIHSEVKNIEEVSDTILTDSRTLTTSKFMGLK